MPKKIKIHSIFLLVIFMLITSLCVYYYSEFERKKDLKEYYSFLQKTFNGKSKLVDKISTPVKCKPYDNFSLTLTSLRDENGNNLEEIYHCNNTGWVIHELKAGYYNEFVYTKYDSQDMGFKVPKNKMEKYKLYNVLLDIQVDDYKLVPTNRGTIQDVFDSKLKFKISELGAENYIPKSISKINNFFTKISDFYFLNRSEKGDYSGNLMIYNEKSIVWYKQSYETWRVKLNEDEYHYFLFKNLTIGNITALFLFLLWKYGKRIEFTR